MANFTRKPLNPSKFNQAVQKNPLIFGIPFVLLMVGASYAVTPFTQARYEVHDQRQKTLSQEQALGLDKKPKRKFDLREEYFRLNAEADEDWEPKRIERPAGTPEWGLPPPEPEPKASSPKS
ncbi:hypothetical protein CYLTODRAFT_417463 [Cylindrobasidium torrendii FP15055 ss-10]|uniref:Cytochrome c oxidase assembly protein COX16, mitochondrial n=1 Tax=Cylindrobasidium torrendii FP15055 ss-10 TaxID=1314674 RepID=A0A0D7BTK8_9AGAR|nr:hypothetical protein CYLTODRAFT_417463 [Cylindrobasidium torrendii FP15055 ss-10]